MKVKKSQKLLQKLVKAFKASDEICTICEMFFLLLTNNMS